VRYAIFSDVHAYPKALETVLAEQAVQKADMRICLGDVVGYGPDPAGAVALCREACDVVTAGNHDAAVAGRIDSRSFIPRAQEAVARHRDMLDEDALVWLADLPMSDLREDFIAIHGEVHQRDGRLAAGFGYVIHGIDAERVFLALPAEVSLAFVGHTHAMDVWEQDSQGLIRQLPPSDFRLRKDRRYIVNVGAVGYPRFERETTYVMYDSAKRSVAFKHLQFDFTDYLKAMKLRGIDPPVWLIDHLRENGVI
jgi:predicted phosphodiesterase